MEQEIESIIKKKWRSNETITYTELLFEEDDILDKELKKYGYFIFNELDVNILITKNEFLILLDIYYNKATSLTYLKNLLEIKDDELTPLISHLKNCKVINEEGEFLYFLKDTISRWTLDYFEKLYAEYNIKKIQLSEKQLNRFAVIETQIKKLDKQVEEYELKVKEFEVKSYQNTIVFMGIFISIFSLISINFNIFEKAMNLSFCDLLKFILVVNVSLGIVIFMLLKTIKNMFIMSKK